MYRPTIKNLILLGIPTILTVLCLIKDLVGIICKTIIIIGIIACAVFYIISLVIYGKKEKYEKNKLEELKESDSSNRARLASVFNILDTRLNIINFMTSIIETWSRRVNQIAYDISRKNTANQSDWKLEEIYEEICCGCKSMIQDFIKEENDSADGEINDNNNISVGFIKYYTKNSTKYVKMIAHSSLQNARPDIYEKEEKLDECLYKYAKLIKDKTHEIIAYENNEKISRLFHKKNESTDLSKYSQYIAVPIICSSNRILGVLQVTAKYDCKIMDSEDNLKRFSRAYITPFTELIMFAEKIHKVLFGE